MPPKTTSFADAARVTPIVGTDNQFEATVPWDWCGQLHAHGGFTVSLIFATTRSYFLAKYPSTPQPDPINSQVHFVQPAPRGRVVLTVTELSHARRYSTVEVKLHDPQGKLCTAATVIQGNLATEKGPSIAVPPTSLSRDELPHRERDCDQFVHPPLITKIMPVSTKMGVLRRKGAETQFLSRSGKLNVKEMWMRWNDPNQKLDVISLGSVCDTLLPAPLNFDPTMADASKYLFPTLCMSVEVKKDPGNAEWLFLEVITHKIHNGRFDSDVRVLDENGDLVALSKHVSAIADVKRTKTTKITIGEEFSKL
ncbi:thioesterase-like superfamily-domain-containing protein [Talaromyces proteolyticus]|uniref:Thioesterase-like superfamily-domain-containing protein n=1 Tax=Talaromyces proteolyticus TaxID=1131652 RepID=A0AAD4PY14_9EURO|nr:thioesterase-like superfamily-domain-containing protein [Talaromyces proteolyticus]KAH8693566.1 thioesterase-like superfamily-domain-containing protein [Talaromyces proteolyticus]